MGQLTQNDVQKIQRMWNWFQKNETKINRPQPIYPRMLGGGGGGGTAIEIKLGTLIEDIPVPSDPTDFTGSIQVLNAEVSPPADLPSPGETLVVVWDFLKAMHGGGGTLLKGAEVAAIKFKDAVGLKPTWQATTSYTEGEQVSETASDDSLLWNWSSNETRISGAAWNPTEEAFWTKVDQPNENALWRLMWWEVLGVGSMKVGDTFRVR